MDNLHNSNLFINSLYKRFFVSTSISTFVRTSVQLVATVLAGSMLGPAALGTVGLLIPFSFVFVLLGALYEIGCSVLCSQYIGANDYDGAKRAVSVAYISNLFFCAVIAVFGLIFLDNILSALKITEEMYSEARIYAIVYLILGLFQPIVSAGNGLLKFDGYLGKLVWINCIAPVSSLIITYLLIKSGQGISAVAIGACVGYALTGIVIVYITAVKTKVLGFAKVTAAQMIKILSNIARYGLSNVAGDVCFIFSAMAINMLLITSYSKLELSAYSTYGTLLGVFGAIYYACALALVQIAGVMKAERDSTSAKQVVRVALIYGMSLSVIAGALAIVFSGQIASLFGMGEGVAREIMRSMLVALAISIVFDTFFFSMYFFFKASERNMVTNIIMICRRLGFLLPPIFILSNIFGMDGVWYSLWICPALCVLALVIYSLIVSAKNKYLTKVFLIDTQAEKNGTYSSFSTGAGVEEIMDCSRSISGFCEQNKLNKSRSNLIALAIEEMLLLIREFSLKKRDGSMNVRILLYEDDVIMRIRNSGDKFNPLEYYKDLNLSKKLTLDESLRHKEFLGLKMVVDTVKNTDYCETFGVNNLTIII